MLSRQYTLKIITGKFEFKLQSTDHYHMRLVRRIDKGLQV